MMSGGYPLYLNFILLDMRIMKRYSWRGRQGRRGRILVRSRRK